MNLSLEFHSPLHLFKDIPDALSARHRLSRLPHERWTARLGEQIGVPPDGTTYLMALALEQIDLEQFDAAVATLQKAIAADPKLSPAYRCLANVYLKQNKPREAVHVPRGFGSGQQPDRVDSRAALIQYLSIARAPVPTLSRA